MSLFKLPKLGNKRWSLAPSLHVCTDVATFHFDKIGNAVEIGRESFAVAHASTYKQMSKQVVVKKILDLEKDEKDLFLKEVKLLNTLKHPNIS